MAITYLGPIYWDLDVDEQTAHRTYVIRHKVKCDPGDGPFEVYNCPDLYKPGDVWDLGKNILIDNLDDFDPWAWCTPYMKITPVETNEIPQNYIVEQKFTTKPLPQCQTSVIEDPLLECYKISGGFNRTTKEAAEDRFGAPVMNSAFEPFHGAAVEFEHNLPTVTVQQNVADLQFDLICDMIDTVNATAVWGFTPRFVRLSKVQWERKFTAYCEVYFERTLEFVVDTNTHDRQIADVGQKVLQGKWGKANQPEAGRWIVEIISGSPADPTNPSHFMRAKDIRGEPIKIVLNGAGLPALVTVDRAGVLSNSGPQGTINVEYYDESDFFELGIPTTFTNCR